MADQFDYSALDDALRTVSKPAQRALVNHGVLTTKALARYSRVDVLSWHGIGPTAVPKLEAALQAHGLAFKK